MSAKMDRLGIGADILVLMNKNDDLPLPNIHILSKRMMAYFKQEGMVDDLKEMGYKWVPTEDYWRRHIREIASLLATDRKRPFCYYRKWGEFSGLWKFCTKKEYEDTLYREYADVSTRTDSYNERLEEVETKWQFEIPHIADVPLLAN